MAVHDTLRGLVQVRGANVLEDPMEFRGALDDFVDESEASIGEINVLVDAVRLGAVRRLTALLDQGGLGVAAIVEAGDGLARDRGSDDPARSRWAVAVIGFALGRIDAETVLRFDAAPGSRSTPTPTPGITLPPTYLPPPPTAAPNAPPPPPFPPSTVPPVNGPPRTSRAPASSIPPPPGPGGTTPQRRAVVRVVVLTALALIVVVAGTVVALVVVRGDDDNSGAPSVTTTSTPPDVGPPPDVPAKALEPGAVVGVRPMSLPAPSGTSAMAARTGGVAVVGAGPVDSVGEGDQTRVAPDGGSLLAFRLAPFEGCASGGCASWPSLGLRVEVGSRAIPLPKGGPCFVVALPEGENDAELVYRADGYRQSLSLATGRATGSNIEVLARDRRDRELTVAAKTGTFEGLVATADPPTGLSTSDLTFDVHVEGAELYFFEPRRPLKDPASAYLRVTAERSTPAVPAPAPLSTQWMRFTDDNGKTYEPIDLDPAADRIDAVFEVPGDLEHGRFTVGGTASLTTTGGSQIRLTLPERTVPLKFGS
ncbi:hypothetical protein [Nocardioides panacisoli]|uniref:Uncharacterized protein n=1 Tax=Nocardioides panacisoli TaxID=627624 RepID=A0ABP7IMK3_9ACTN